MTFFAALFCALMLLGRRLTQLRSQWLSVWKVRFEDESDETEFDLKHCRDLLEERDCMQEWWLTACFPLLLILFLNPEDAVSRLLVFAVLTLVFWLAGVLYLEQLLKKRKLAALNYLFKVRLVLSSWVRPIRSLKHFLLPLGPGEEEIQSLVIEHRANMSHQCFLALHGSENPMDEQRLRDFLLNLDKLFTQSVQSVMTPIHHVVTLSPGITVAEACEKSAVTGFSRLPVMDSRGKVVGIFRANQLGLLVQRESRVESELDDELSVPAESTVWEAFRLLQENRRQMGVVYRGQQVAGLITIEDILEELVGDIEDEFDTALVKRVARDTYEVDARIGMGPLERILGKLPSSRGVSSLASWLHQRLSKPLRVGTLLDVRDLRIVVTELENQQHPMKVRIYRLGT